MDVLVIGAGLSGLTCARHLHEQGLDVQVVEAYDGVGGRVRTDVVDGFQLDRGFQVLLTAYPETQRELDYETLDLNPFYDGALVRVNGRFRRIGDPFRHPIDGLRTLAAPIGSLPDKLRVARMRRSLINTSVSTLMQRPEISTMEALRERWGFSDRMINRFFRPFLGGIFFDRSLGASSRMFEFVFKMFASGQTVLPADGIEALPRQMAANLPDDTVRLNTRATAIENQTVYLSGPDGDETVEAPAIVVATEAPVANELVGEVTPTERRSTCCLYYAAPASPFDRPILALNGDGDGPINNLAVVSDVAPSYSPDDRALVSITVVGDPGEDDDLLERSVRQQLISWFGLAAGGWEHLRTYRIRYALPEQAPPFLSPPERSVRRRPGLYVCGDHRRTASLNGAIASGRAAAAATLADRQRQTA
jgi:phytoene dehydrogenase-like protein